MILSGATWLCSLFSLPIPSLFYHTSTRILLSAGTTFLICLILGPTFIRKLTELKIGQPIRDYDGFLLTKLHKKKKNTPTMGGGLIVFSILISMLLWSDWSSPFVFILCSTMIVFGALGAIDDWAKLKTKSSKGIPGKVRFLIQTLWALIVITLLFYPSLFEATGFHLPFLLQKGRSVPWHQWMAETFFPFVSNPVCIAAGVSWAFVWFIQWFTIVGTANAANLTDGLDGLAAGICVLIAFPLILVAFVSNHQELSYQYAYTYIESSGEIAVILSSLIGACVGFLWFNSHPAEVFMGDTGALSIGGLLGTSAVLLKQEWLLALIAGVFVIETVSVMIQVFYFKRTGKRVFLCSPIHHHFEFKGLAETKVVIRFWIAGLVLSALGILSILVKRI